MVPSPYFLVQSLINWLGLYQSLALLIISSCQESKTVLELNNILVVHDFLNIFMEVSPGCPLTVMLSSRSSWFSYKPPLLQEFVLDTPELVGQAKQQLGELEDKRLANLVHVKGYICVC